MEASSEALRFHSQGAIRSRGWMGLPELDQGSIGGYSIRRTSLTR